MGFIEGFNEEELRSVWVEGFNEEEEACVWVRNLVEEEEDVRKEDRSV